MAGKLLLNYHDAVVYESDLSILECPTAWLNDAIIHFHMTRLQHNMQPDSSSGSSLGEQIDLFLDPSVISYLMHQCDEDDEDFRDEISNMHQAWQLSSASHKRVFVPINDQFNASRTAFAKPGGGSHWSLLLWTVSKNPSPSSIPSCTFYHFDSSSGYNTTAALAVSQKLMKVLYCGTKTDPIHIGAADVNECKTPQQCNAYDCGVFLLGFAEALSSAKDDFTPKYCKEKFEDTVSSFASRDEFAVKLRRRIYEDIRTLLASKI